MDRRKLESIYYLTVNNISFAGDAIGAASGTGRSATTTWAQGDTVVFKGKLKHILVFAVMAFDVASVAVNESFTLTPERKFLNMPSPGNVAVIDIDPAQGEGIVLEEDLIFMQNLTNNYRFNWGDVFNMIVEERATPTNKQLFRGSVLEALAYGFQYHTTGGAPVYTLYDFALMGVGDSYNKGVDFIDIDGESGPVELEKGHVTVANSILGF